MADGHDFGLGFVPVGEVVVKVVGKTEERVGRQAQHKNQKREPMYIAMI